MSLVYPADWRPQGVEDLEPGAWEALRETSRCVLVTAGAGAGKTEFLAQKAAYLLQTGICPSPKRILAISFKRDAARNLTMRLEKRCTPEQARRFHSFTFDAFAKGLLDRFRAAIPGEFQPPSDYRIVMPGQKDYQEAIKEHNIPYVNAQQLESLVITTDLPLEGDDLNVRAVRSYWQSQYQREVLLSFPMIKRLVLLLLKENVFIRRALQITYPVIFLDEFQDITGPQYELLRAAFHGASPNMTAVGDDKQRIMGWAGAMPDAFQRFSTDHDACRIQLLCNWRSHKELVRIQHVIARQIDQNVVTPVARAKRTVGGEIAAIWQFDTEAQEAEMLASWLAREVENNVVEPHKTAVLVRMRAKEIEAKLSLAFIQKGLRLRNLARDIGGISIQDVLSEELTQILLPILRLGSTTRSPENWEATVRNLQFLEAIGSEDDKALQKLHRRLDAMVRTLRATMQNCQPTDVIAEAVALTVLGSIRPESIRNAFPQYNRQQDFDRVWGGIITLLKECASVGTDWPTLLDEFEGLGQVVLMTIHKSKGLEFHTMIFYGLDNQTWWSLRQNRKEELSSFFVAFTRARQRAFFTFCSGRGQPVDWIERLLQPVGLLRIRGQELIP
ncbi:UvrD-helicase domain-containing protein [Megalodesulfovibrio gigas]|uniref:DNA 3'-5' helicase n=1 Tax=Megalodesulfovibrio gigas (strain ATCC 19364 / DSM 1382 / NCIMB 9332 / VKM B-1759) TaxID=1121448 RepID=T2G7X8_MEGG1|nr:ATP-dependent helicase [Megalodesulfovibrio gigas]AGW12393.1 putative uvrD/REP helicase family protein [Megalodesulfovibrio gigas DSM 1382 = ATCC 19364]